MLLQQMHGLPAMAFAKFNGYFVSDMPADMRLVVRRALAEMVDYCKGVCHLVS